MLHECCGRGCGGAEPAGGAVAPGALEDELLEEGAGGGGHEPQGAGAFAHVVHGFGADEGEAAGVVDVLGEGFEGLVDEGAFEKRSRVRGVELEVVVGVDAGESGFVALDEGCLHEAEAVLGLPAVVEELALVFDDAVDGGGVDPLSHRGFDGLGELGGDGFVGIEPEGVVGCAGVEGELLGFDEAAPLGFDEQDLAGPPLSAGVNEVEGGVGGAGIDDDELGCEGADRVEDAPHGALIVAAWDHDAEGGRMG